MTNEWMNDWDLFGTFLKCPSFLLLAPSTGIIQLQCVSAPSCLPLSPLCLLFMTTSRQSLNLLAKGHSASLTNPL